MNRRTIREAAAQPAQLDLTGRPSHRAFGLAVMRLPSDGETAPRHRADTLLETVRSTDMPRECEDWC